MHWGCMIGTDVGGNWYLMTEVRYQSAFDSLGLIDGGNGSLRTDEIFGGGDEENGEILGKNYFAFLQEGAQGTEWGGAGLWWH